MRRALGAVGVLAGAMLIAASIVALIVAVDGARHGWASLGDAAPVPVLALAVGAGIAIAGALALRRR